METARRLTVYGWLLTGVVACGAEPAPVDQVSRGTQCGPTLDFIPINEYEGRLFWMDEREEAVAFVNGSCSGTLVESLDPEVFLVLTAGHCVGLGDEALIVFNHEDAMDGPYVATTGLVVEHAQAPDYALVELVEDPGFKPTRFGTRFTNELAVIQHPRGQPKVVATGFFANSSEGRVRYADLDTLVGSSGAGVLNSNGRMVGMHTGGDCDEDGGTNAGWTMTSIVEASTRLDESQLDGC